jgi:hypothetical protein
MKIIDIITNKLAKLYGSSNRDDFDQNDWKIVDNNNHKADSQSNTTYPQSNTTYPQNKKWTKKIVEQQQNIADNSNNL